MENLLELRVFAELIINSVDGDKSTQSFIPELPHYGEVGLASAPHPHPHPRLGHDLFTGPHQSFHTNSGLIIQQMLNISKGMIWGGVGPHQEVLRSYSVLRGDSWGCSNLMGMLEMEPGLAVCKANITPYLPQDLTFQKQILLLCTWASYC